MLRNTHRSLLLLTALLLLAGITYSLPTVRATLKHTLAGGDTLQNSSQAERLKRNGSLKAKALSSLEARGSRMTTEAKNAPSEMRSDGKAESYAAMGTGQNGTATSHPAQVSCPTPTLGNYATTTVTVGGRATTTP